MAGETPNTPAEQAISGVRAGKGGVVPPPEHRWQPGQSGNPNGRPSAGATLTEWVNVLAEQQLTEAELRVVARDKTLPWPKRAAAERILRTLEAGDVADFAPALDGFSSLKDLRDVEGINTEVIKKFKVKRRTLQNGEEIVERELELHDRAGSDFDRLCDRTDGRPHQRVTKSVDVSLRTPQDGEAKAAEIIARLRERLGLRCDN